MSDAISLLQKLSGAFGPPGNEDQVRDILKGELEEFADEVRVDKLGNIFFYYHGKKQRPKVMLTAHMDEVAFLVTFVEDTGFLRFQPLGGIANNVMPGQLIVLRGSKGYVRGVIGTKPPHIMTKDEREKVLQADDLFIDVGVESLEEANEKGVAVGAVGVFDVQFQDLGGGYLRGKAFDDRAGCTVLSQVFKALKSSSCNLVAVGTVQEEVGLRGARTAAWQTDPDYGLALEGTFAADVPGSRPDKMSAKLKGGPVITIVDRATITHPAIFKTLIKLGKDKSIPFQFKKVPTGGTDAGAIHLTRAGVPAGTVAVPCRYIHGPASIAHVKDLENATSLVTEFVKTMSR